MIKELKKHCQNFFKKTKSDFSQKKNKDVSINHEHTDFDIFELFNNYHKFYNITILENVFSD